jgi:hypothetical protein
MKTPTSRSDSSSLHRTMATLPTLEPTPIPDSYKYDRSLMADLRNSFSQKMTQPRISFGPVAPRSAVPFQAPRQGSGAGWTSKNTEELNDLKTHRVEYLEKQKNTEEMIPELKKKRRELYKNEGGKIPGNLHIQKAQKLGAKIGGKNSGLTRGKEKASKYKQEIEDIDKELASRQAEK